MRKRPNLSTALLGAVALAASSGAALALSGASPTPPAGQPAATAPGGTQGLAGPRNVSDAIRGGQAIGVPPGAVRGRDGRWYAAPPGYGYPPYR